MIKREIDKIIKLGTKYDIDRDHFKICYDGKCIVFMQLSPLHCLAKTVYLKDDEVAI